MLPGKYNVPLHMKNWVKPWQISQFDDYNKLNILNMQFLCLNLKKSICYN